MICAKRFLFLICLGLTLNVWAPKPYYIEIEEGKPISSYDILINAIVKIESDGNTLAFNPLELATGAFQIRPIKLLDYNMRTGNTYTLDDMYDYEISKEIFLYHASKYGYDFERIAKAWNGSGPMTELYWQKVKQYLN